MTFGEKLKNARKEAGLSQEQLAEKMSVSRSAVAKWESNKGMPDIENLKNISQLLSISIDSLLDEEEKISFSEIKEPIVLADYEKTGKARSKEDAVVIAKYPKAEHIYALVRTKKLNKAENILDFLICPGIFQIADYSHDMSSYYLVESANKQYFVNVSKEFVTSSEIAKKITKKKFVIGQNKFIIAYDLV